MNRLDYYFRQKVTEAELDLGFTHAESADRAIVADAKLYGLSTGGAVTQQVVPDMTALVDGPCVAYDSAGQRCAFTPDQTVNCAVDYNAITTAVVAPGNAKVVSIYLQFERALSDPRTDGNAVTVNFVRAESFKFKVVQGTEAAVGLAAPAATPVEGGVLLADITLIFGSASITNSMISTARRNDVVNSLGGSPRALQSASLNAAVLSLLGYYNNHVNGVADPHPATAVAYAGGGTWADASTNPATTVEGQLDKIITDLAVSVGASGTARIGSQAIAGSPRTLAAGTLRAQLTALLGFLDAFASTGGTDGASLVGAALSGSLPAGTVRSQLTWLNGIKASLSSNNSFNGKQTWTLLGDTNTLHEVGTAPAGAGTKKLLWTIPTFNVGKIRVYAEGHGGLTISLNAVWLNSVNWQQDTGATPGINGSLIAELSTGNSGEPLLRLRGYFDGTNTFIISAAQYDVAIDSSGIITAPGALTCSFERQWRSAVVGSTEIFSAYYGKHFDAAASSYFFTVGASTNVTGSPTTGFTDFVDSVGVEVVATSGASTNTYIRGTILVFLCPFSPTRPARAPPPSAPAAFVGSPSRSPTSRWASKGAPTASPTWCFPHAPVGGRKS